MNLQKYWRNNMNDNNNKNMLTNVLFIIYLIALFWIIVLKFNVPFSYMGNLRRINLIPFSESAIIINLIPFGEYTIINGKLNVGEIIMNVVIFVPLGIYAGILFQRWIVGKKLFLFFLISLICEGFQIILGVGAFDITDIINNTLGGIIGLMIYKGIEKVFKNSVKAVKFTNIIVLIGTILMILFLFLLKINKLWIFRM
jgi:glycopeptide antibiotics resistance protein